MIQCVEPDIDTGLEDKYLRRMSRLIRLGWSAAKMCLDDAGGLPPEAIITGSGWGSVQDSEKFLLSIYRNKENFLPPTPFIQSTHNAVGAQIALLLNSYDYNMSYAHITSAFEHALLDSMLRLNGGESERVLCGGFDEITPNQFTLISRLKRFRKEPVANLGLYAPAGEGSIAGEGFNFFFLQNKKTEKTYAEVKWVETILTEDIAADPLIGSRIKGEGIDWVFAGYNGDAENDRHYRKILPVWFPGGVNVAAWKHLSGEYLTASAFAMWVAAGAIREQLLPETLKFHREGAGSKLRKILIYNHFKGKYHQFILLSQPE